MQRTPGGRPPAVDPSPAEPGAQGARHGPTELSRGWALALLAIIIGAFMSILDSTIVNIAVPAMMHDFNTNTTGIQWVLTIYLLALGVVVPISGWLGDRYGYKRVYVTSLVIFTAGSALSGLSWSLNSLIVARVIQAVGGGLIMPITMTMVYALVPRDRLGTAMGFYGLTLLFAPAVGPTLGGYLVQYVNWRLIFTVNIPIGIVGLIMAAMYIREIGGESRERLDVPGFVTVAVGLFALLLALSEGQTYGWQSEFIVLLFFVAAVALIAFVWIEMGVEHPLINLRVFGFSTFTLSQIISVVMVLGLYGGSFYVPLFLQTVRGLGALPTGLALMPGALATGIMMPIAGRIYDRSGPRGLALVGMVVLAIGTYLFHGLSLATTTGTVAFWMIVRGVGMGLVMMPVMTAGLAVIPDPLIGRASAVSNIVQRVSGSFGIALLTSMLTAYTASHYAGLAVQTGGRTAAAVAGMAASGMSRAGALGLLAGRLHAQAFTLAVDDLFVVMALVVVAGLLPALVLKRGRITGPASERRAPALGLE